MNLLFLVSSLNFGGAERQTVLDANLLSTRHNVCLGFYGDGGLSQLVDNNVKLIKIKKTGYFTTTLRVLEIIRNNNIQLIHASLFSSMVLASMASIVSGVKVIWHFHSHEFDIPLHSRIAFRLLAKLPNVRKILFVNHELMEYYSPYNFPSLKTGVLYNHSELTPSLTKIKDANNQIVNIGYIGRVVGLKRVDYLVEFASMLFKQKIYGFKLHIVGDGEELNGLKELTANQCLEGFIEFYGFQTNVAAFYNRFDFFVNPSSEECLSIAMIDAGIMGLPIVSFDVGGNNEIVIDKKSGFITTSKNDFFDACLTLTQNENLRIEMGLKAVEHCSMLFNKEKHLNEILDIYEEIK